MANYINICHSFLNKHIMKILETYIIQLHEQGEFAKLYKSQNSHYIIQYIIETKTDTYSVSTQFVNDKQFIL